MTAVRRTTLLYAAAWILLYTLLMPIIGAIAAAAGLPDGERWSEAIKFFVYETPKVVLLLTAAVFLIGIVRTYFSPERTRSLLGGKRLLTGNVAASALGIVTPFCSCSAVPLFIGFVEAGIPLGVTFSFLIAAPMINEIALVLLWELFGWKTALVYVTSGLLIAITSGVIIGMLRLERFVEPWVFTVHSTQQGAAAEPSFDDRLESAFLAVRDVVGKVWPYVMAGIGVGAWVHGYVPENLLSGIMGKSAWWAVPVSVLIGVPLYSSSAGIIPIVHALLEKGASLGTALAFMMSVIGLSLPEMIILRKVLRLPLIAAFVGIVAVGIILVGYLFNVLY